MANVAQLLYGGGTGMKKTFLGLSQQLQHSGASAQQGSYGATTGGGPVPENRMATTEDIKPLYDMLCMLFNDLQEIKKLIKKEED